MAGPIPWLLESEPWVVYRVRRDLLQEPEEDDQVRAARRAMLDWLPGRSLAHPSLFYIGTDFSKIKAAPVWYDILHVLDVLTQFQIAWQDSRLQEIVAIVQNKANALEQYTPESIWTAWKDWAFGQKRNPSAGILHFILHMLRRTAFN